MSTAAAQVTVSGVVQTQSSTAVAGALLEFRQAQVVVDSDTSKQDGSYSVSLPAGTYTLLVTPPGGSNFAAQTINNLNFSSNTTLNIALVTASTQVTYSGKVVNGHGAPVAGVRMTLTDTNGMYVFSVTDADGNFSKVALRGEYDAGLWCHQCSPANEYYSLKFAHVDLSSSSISGVEFVVQDRVLDVTVTDNLGAPLANADVAWTGTVDYANGPLSGSSGFEGHTDASGKLTLRVMPGTGSLLVKPPSGSELGTQTVMVTVADQAHDPAPLTVMLDLAQTSTYAGRIVDRHGDGFAGLRAMLTDSTGTYRFSVSDANGNFSQRVDPQPYTTGIWRYSGSGPDQEGFSVTLGQADLSNSSLTGVQLIVEDRQLAITVHDKESMPLGNAVLVWNEQVSYAHQGGVATGGDYNRGTTDAEGKATLRVLPGSGTLEITPPSGSALSKETRQVVVPDQTQDPDPVLVTMGEAHYTTYAGRVVDQQGAGIANLRVTIAPSGGSYTLTMTDSDGNFSFSIEAKDIVPGDYDVAVECRQCASPDQGWYLTLATTDLSAGSTQDVLFTITDLMFTGTVVDVDDRKIGDTELHWRQEVSDAQGARIGNAEYNTRTDSDGRFFMRVFPGQGSLQATPAPTTGLAPFSISDLPITTDQNLVVVTQFLSEQVTQTVGAGGVVSSGSGDGASLSDPLETAVTLPEPGTVTIDERPISEAAPSGYRYLTQEIAISAPSASSGKPLEFKFDLDATRVPDGMAGQALHAFRNGVPIRACNNNSGRAEPDPCVASQTTLSDGDLRFVILTSAASTWNIGRMSASEAGCGNAVLENGEDCDDGNAADGDCCSATCSFEPSRVACNDGDPCTITSTCNGAGQCTKGTPSDSACDDGEACTTDQCDQQASVCRHTPIDPCMPQPGDNTGVAQPNDAGTAHPNAGAAATNDAGAQAAAGSAAPHHPPELDAGSATTRKDVAADGCSCRAAGAERRARTAPALLSLLLLAGATFGRVRRRRRP